MESEQGVPPTPRETTGPAHLLDTLVEAYVVLDDGGLVVEWNRAAQDLLGWSREEALGREGAELFVPEEHRAAHRAGVARVVAGGRFPAQGRRLELVAVDRRGRRFPVEVTLRLQPDPDHGSPRVHGFLHDITERDQVHRDLHERELFLRSVVDALDVGVLACDASGRLVVVNETMRRVQADVGRPVGPTVEMEHLAETFCLYRPDGHTLLGTEELPLLRALRGEDVADQEVVVRPPGRAPVRFRVAGRRLTSVEGDLIGAVVELHDVTAAHRSALLRAGAAAFALETAGAEADGDSLRRGLSVLAGELQWRRVGFWVAGGAGHLDLAAGWEPGGVPRPWSPTLAQEAVERGDLAWRTSVDGERSVAFPVTSGSRTIGALEFADQGYAAPGVETVSMLLSVSAQIARHEERRRAEELAGALAEERAAFDRVLSQVDDHVWSIELLPDGSAVPVYESPNVDAILGTDWPAGDDKNRRTLLQRILPEDLPRFRAYLEQGRQGRLADVEVRIRGFDDVVRWIWVRGAPRREGERLFVDGISTDVTERHELQAERERLLRQSHEQAEEQVRRLHEVDRLKDEFLATVSHELRNPLSVIKGYADLVAGVDGVGEDTRTMLDVIRRRAAQLQQLVEELFAHARIEAGLLELQRVPVQLDGLVEELVRGYARTASEAGLALSADLRCGRDVEGDEVRLRQVFDNVLGNAIKYTPDGGAVTVRSRVADGRAVVEVVDTGIGVPEQERPRLFEKLFRSSSAVQAGIEGTGLGLAVSRSLVEAHGGTIEAGANPGGGSVFTVRLPLDGSVSS